MRVLITGGEGQLGVALRDLFSTCGEAASPGRGDLDICDRAAVERWFGGAPPDLVIHAAAWTDVDGCERDPSRAFRVNEKGARTVAEACRRAGARLVLISTDFVFDGETERPYTEGDRPDPISAYGRSKLAGEEAVLGTISSALVVRTAWLYGEGGKGNFVRSILGNAAKGKALRVVADQWGSPSYTRDVAAGIVALVSSAGEGILHMVNGGEASRYDLARAALDLSGGEEVPIEKIRSADLNQPAPRPRRSTLRSTRMEELGLSPLRHWREALEDHIRRSR